MSFAKIPPEIAVLQPEVALGGFTAYDGTIEFYSRIRALINEDMVVLDFGAGRAAWFEDEDSGFRRSLRSLKGKVKEIIGCDLDPAVLENRAVDRTIVLTRGAPLPFADSSIDMVISDYVFEHVENAAELALEIHRILKPGGWVCARTPTKYNYVTIASRAVSNLKHAKILRLVQPSRKAEDVFPTVYELNSRKDVESVFKTSDFDNYSYIYCFEPQYHFGKAWVYRMFRVIHWLLPASLQGNLYIFLKKRTAQVSGCV
jgi:SAM-dependent methyltransferase